VLSEFKAYVAAGSEEPRHGLSEEESSHAARIMRRSEERRPSEVTVFVDANAHLQEANLGTTESLASPARHVDSTHVESEVQRHLDLPRQVVTPSTQEALRPHGAGQRSDPMDVKTTHPPHESAKRGEHSSHPLNPVEVPRKHGDLHLEDEPLHSQQTGHGKQTGTQLPPKRSSKQHGSAEARESVSYGEQAEGQTQSKVHSHPQHTRHTDPLSKEDVGLEAREESRSFNPPLVMSQSELGNRHTHKRSRDPDQSSEEKSKSVAGRRLVSLSSVGVAQSREFAEQLISQERESLCPHLPSRISLEILAANTKIAEELTFVFKAKLTTEAHKIANQAVQILRTGIEVEWKESSAGTTNDEQSALARAEDELQEQSASWDPISRGAKLILPLSACDLMNETFSLMCNRGTKIHADGTFASLSEQESSSGEEAQVEASLRQLRELYLSLPGGLGVMVEKEQEAYEAGLKRQEHLGAMDPRHRLSLLQEGEFARFPATFSWLYERPQCLDYVHHQGTCGACYMFAALDSLSDRHCIDSTNASRLGHIEHLSVQMALLCEPLGRQCAGGWADVGFNYSVYFGLQTASKWPYERSCLSDSQCQFGKQCFSPASYACPSFFSQEELDEVSTFSDALRVTKRKCETSSLEDPDNCKVWAETMFAMSPSMIFMPEGCFCEELVADWQRLSQDPNRVQRSRDGSGIPTILLQGRKRRDDEDEEGGFNFFEWLASLFFGSSQESQKDTSTANYNSEIPGGTWSSGSDSASASSPTLTTTTVEQCSRDRCVAEPQPHKATRYHYIVNQKDVFKMEIFNDGPFYTSFYVYEDFTWFFQFWPEDGYNYQWGAMQGGHAVVLIGWESSCHYHGDKIAIPGDNDPVRQNTDSSRRRQSTGECWHLRNTWGDEWGDKGYFRFADDMLTGPPGYHIHIASAAADGPKSVETSVI